MLPLHNPLKRIPREEIVSAAKDVKPQEPLVDHWDKYRHSIRSSLRAGTVFVPAAAYTLFKLAMGATIPIIPLIAVLGIAAWSIGNTLHKSYEMHKIKEELGLLPEPSAGLGSSA